MSSLASEDSLCRGRKEGSPQPSSWGLCDCGVKRYSHLRQLWQPGPLQVAKSYSKDVRNNGDPHCCTLTVHRGLGQGFVHHELILCPHCNGSAPLQIRKRYGSNPLRVYCYEVQEQANHSMLRGQNVGYLGWRYRLGGAQGSSWR